MILIYLNCAISNLYHSFIWQKNFHFFLSKDEILVKRCQLLCMRRRQYMTSVGSNFDFLCGGPHRAGPPPPVHMRPPEPDPLPPPRVRHKWMAPKDMGNLEKKI